VTDMKEIMKMAKKMAMEFTTIRVVTDMKEIMKMANKVAMEPSTGMMVTDMKEILKMAKKMAMEFITTRVVTDMKEIMKITKEVKEFTTGKMDTPIQVIGRVVKVMDMVNNFMIQATFTHIIMDPGKKTKYMDKESCFGLMDACMKEISRMIACMVWV